MNISATRSLLLRVCAQAAACAAPLSVRPLSVIAPHSVTRRSRARSLSASLSAALLLCALLCAAPARAADGLDTSQDTFGGGGIGGVVALWIDADQTALRVWRSAEAEVLLRLPRGTLVTPLYAQPPWTRVREPGGQEGWVYQGQLAQKPPQAAPALAVIGLFDPEPPSMILAEAAESARSTRSATVHTDDVHTDSVHSDGVHAGGVHSDAVHMGGAGLDAAGRTLRDALDLPLTPDDLDDFLASGGVGEFAPGRGPAPASAIGQASFPRMEATARAGGETERQVGLNLAAAALRDMVTPAFGTARARYVNLVGLAVARFAPGNGARLRVIVLESPRPVSFSLPGGIVMLSTGLLAALDNEAQLACVLAHETAHAALAHLWSRALRAPFLRNGGRLDPAGVREPAFRAMIDDLLRTALVRGLDANLEFQADLAAVEMVWRAGYDPRELPRAIERIAAAGKVVEKAEQGTPSRAAEDAPKVWAALHPPTAERLAHLRLLLISLPARNALALNTARYRANR